MLVALGVLSLVATVASQVNCNDGCVVGECVNRNCTVPQYGTCVRFNAAGSNVLYPQYSAPSTTAQTVGRWQAGDVATVLQGPIRAVDGTSFFFLDTPYGTRSYAQFGRTAAVPWFSECPRCDALSCTQCVARGCTWCDNGVDQAPSTCIVTRLKCEFAAHAAMLTTEQQCEASAQRTATTQTRPATNSFYPPPPEDEDGNDALVIGLAILGAVCGIFVLVLIFCIAKTLRPPPSRSITVSNAAFADSGGAGSGKGVSAHETAFDLRQKRTALDVTASHKEPKFATGKPLGYVNDDDGDDEPEFIPDSSREGTRELRRDPIDGNLQEPYNQVPNHSKVPMLLPPLVDPAYNQVPLRKVAAPTYTNVPEIPTGKSLYAVGGVEAAIASVASDEPDYDQLELRRTKLAASTLENAVDVEPALDD
jgi:hypothetical protein